jgi:hypothetical protein
MKKYLISFIFLIFLTFSCGSDIYYFNNKNISIKSNIKEKHQIIDNRLIKPEGKICLLSVEDLKDINDNFLVQFKEIKFHDYNFIISFNKESFLQDNFLDANFINLNKNGIYKVEFKKPWSDRTNYYIYERKIKNGYIQFTNSSNSDIELDFDFLFQKFNEIEIIGKQ